MQRYQRSDEIAPRGGGEFVTLSGGHPHKFSLHLIYSASTINFFHFILPTPTPQW